MGCKRRKTHRRTRVGGQPAGFGKGLPGSSGPTPPPPGPGAISSRSPVRSWPERTDGCTARRSYPAGTESRREPPGLDRGKTLQISLQHLGVSRSSTLSSISCRFAGEPRASWQAADGLASVAGIRALGIAKEHHCRSLGWKQHHPILMRAQLNGWKGFGRFEIGGTRPRSGQIVPAVCPYPART